MWRVCWGGAGNLTSHTIFPYNYFILFQNDKNNSDQSVFKK